MWNPLNNGCPAVVDLLAAATPLDDLAYKAGFIVGQGIGLLLFAMGICYLVRRITHGKAPPNQLKTKKPKRTRTPEPQDDDN